ncbi:30S ribosomal protein S1 [Planctomycetales bacterium 10988]|nr:30S ribosomal protein S1 [Planctomycetales bacterium 10988]
MSSEVPQTPAGQPAPDSETRVKEPNESPVEQEQTPAESAEANTSESQPETPEDTAEATTTESTAAPVGEASSELEVPAESPAVEAPADEGASSEEPPQEEAKIKIGSQRDGASQEVSATPTVAPTPLPPVEELLESQDGTPAGSTSKPDTPAQKTPLPNLRESDAEIESELSEAIGSQSLEQMLAKPADSKEGADAKGERLRARVLKIHGDNVFADIKKRNEGVFALKQFGDQPPKIGDYIDAAVESFDEEEGLYKLRRPNKAVEAEEWEELTVGTVVSTYVVGLVKGGLEARVGKIRGFIPASQTSLIRVEDLSEFLGQTFDCLVTESKPQRRNLVLSRRKILERERDEARKKLLESLEAGQTIEGTVRTIKDFGAFVDLGGVDGLLPVSQLSWARVRHPKDLLEVGQGVKVKIQKIDPKTRKISLSLRDLEANPWSDVESKYPVGENVKGKVTKIIQHGALLELEPAVEGMIHISELDYTHVKRVGDVVKEGQELEVQVLSVDPSKRRIALSLKATKTAPEPKEDETYGKVPDGKNAPKVKKKRNAPLKGGLKGGDSDGSQFGLKW